MIAIDIETTKYRSDIMLSSNEKNDHLRDLVATVAAAYFSNVHVPQSEIASVMSTIAGGLRAIDGEVTSEPEPQADTPALKATAAQIRKSITPEGLISFEDGKSYKTLKRHLTIRGLTPAAYREKWGLPNDYPLVAASYSAARSKLAREAGLGRKPGETAAKRKTKA